MNVTNVRWKGHDPATLLEKAAGKLDGVPFTAVQYKDSRGGARGAEPVRWAVYLKRGPVSRGQRASVSRRLNWLMERCRFCLHRYNATECYLCKFEEGAKGCKKGKCRTFRG